MTIKTDTGTIMRIVTFTYRAIKIVRNDDDVNDGDQTGSFVINLGAMIATGQLPISGHNGGNGRILR